jgi:hypothetical protein
MRIAVFAAALLMGGCTVSLPFNLPGTTANQGADVSIPLSFGAGATKPPPCPPEIAYTPAQNKAIVDFVEAPASDPVIVGVLADYHNMRVADDVCLHPTK